MKNRLPPSWAKHLKATPQPATGQRPRVQTDDEILRLARENQKQGRRREAEHLCVSVLTRSPSNPDALYLAGTLALDGKDNSLAITYLERAVRGKPTDALFQVVLAQAYEDNGDLEIAQEHFRQALALKPTMIQALSGVGRTLVRSGEAALGLPFLEKAYRTDRNHKAVRVGLAEALMDLGRMDEAIEHLKAAISRREHVASAWLSLANTRKFSGDPPELQSIRDELANPALPASDAYRLHCSAGKILNDLERYDEAVEQFQMAKTVVGHDFDIELYRRWIDDTIDLFSPELMKAKADLGDPSDVPIFIVGMPRSGTTLTEQILASHPSVHGAGEVTKLPRLARSVGATKESLEPFRKSVSAMNAEQSRAIAGDYLSYLRGRSPDTLRVVDKLPHNFESIGLIALLFPNARIIHCRRDAIDTCVSCFMTNFNDKHGYNADMQKLGLYYREYDRLMRHWNALLPGRIYECRYETLIADQEAESRRLIQYLGLPWDDGCLRFHEQERSVSTPSRWQVRQPIYTSSVKRWKKYEGKIQPLIEALGDLADV